MKITYTMQGDYLLPNLKLPVQDSRPIGLWGKQHLRYIERNHKIRYINLLTKCKLNDYIADIAKKVDIHIKGEEYEGKLPQEAVKTGFNSKERILAKILSNNLGVKIISSMYRH